MYKKSREITKKIRGLQLHKFKVKTKIIIAFKKVLYWSNDKININSNDNIDNSKIKNIILKILMILIKIIFLEIWLANLF